MINYDYDAVRYNTNLKWHKLWIFSKILAYYTVCYILAVIDIDKYAFIGKNIIMLALIAGITASLVSHLLVPSDRPNQMKTLKQNFLIYTGVLLGAHFLIGILSSMDGNMAGISLGMNAGEVTGNAALGWITMMLQFIIVGTPISHVLYEVKRIFTFYGFGFGKTTKRKRMEQLQKTIVK